MPHVETDLSDMSAARAYVHGRSERENGENMKSSLPVGRALGAREETLPSDWAVDRVLCQESRTSPWEAHLIVIHNFCCVTHFFIVCVFVYSVSRVINCDQPSPCNSIAILVQLHPRPIKNVKEVQGQSTVTWISFTYWRGIHIF